MGMSLVSGHSRSRGMYFSVLTKVMYFCYWLGACWARYQRSPYYVQVNRHSIQSILIILLTIIILGEHIALKHYFLHFTALLIARVTYQSKNIVKGKLQKVSLNFPPF